MLPGQGGHRMLQRLGQSLAVRLRYVIPDPFVFALGLTLIVGLLAVALTDSAPVAVLGHWYEGFWALLAFGMQMVLILTTGYAIALSPAARSVIDRLGRSVDRPAHVYFLVTLVGGMLVLVSWGWVALTAVFAREMAQRVRGLDYAYLTACVYVSSQIWVGGLSSSIPLLMNTDGNFLIETGVLAEPLGVDRTLGSSLNLVFLGVYLLLIPGLMVLLRPRRADATPIEDMLHADTVAAVPVEKEAAAMSLAEGSPAERLNRSATLQAMVAFAGLGYVVVHFAERGFSIDLNVMIFIFLMVGMLGHRTPVRFVVAMRRACANVSGIIFQYPFYAGIMGIMSFSGLATSASDWIVGHASVDTLPALAQFAGAAVNFAIPSAGGEWAVIGPSITEAAKSLAALEGIDPERLVARVAMAVAYGETSTNLLQPFFLLVILPVMGAGIRLHARDVVGHLVLPFVVTYAISALMVSFVPL